MALTNNITHIKNLDTKITLIATAFLAGLIGAYSLGYSFAAKNNRGSGTVQNQIYYNLVVDDGNYPAETTATFSSNDDIIYSHVQVQIECYQQDSLVIDNMQMLDSDGYGIFALGPTVSWKQGQGDADCNATAKLWDKKQQRFIAVTSSSFQVFE